MQRHRFLRCNRLRVNATAAAASVMSRARPCLRWWVSATVPAGAAHTRECAWDAYGGAGRGRAVGSCPVRRGADRERVMALGLHHALRRVDVDEEGAVAAARTRSARRFPVALSLMLQLGARWAHLLADPGPPGSGAAATWSLCFRSSLFS